MLRKFRYQLIHGVNRLLLRKRLALTPSLAGLSRRPLVDLAEHSHDYVRFAMWELLAHEINEAGLPGAVAELGVYRGRSAALLNRLFPDRTLYLFDTFDGFDGRDLAVEAAAGYSAAKIEFQDTSVEQVLARMAFPERCVVRAGYFPETAAGLEDQFAFVSLDADLYQPLLDGLRTFYPRLVVGGAIFVHDYNHQKFTGAKAAVREFCQQENVQFLPIPDTAGSAVIQKQGERTSHGNTLRRSA